MDPSRLQLFAADTRQAARCQTAITFTELLNDPAWRSAESSGGIENGLKHRVEIGRRGSDDPQYLCRRRLLFQCLAQIGVALLQFPKQARVLDGDDGLVREGFE